LKQQIIKPSEAKPSSPVDRTTNGPVDRTTQQSDGPDYIGPVDRTATNTHKQFFKADTEAGSRNKSLGLVSNGPDVTISESEILADSDQQVEVKGDGPENQPTAILTASGLFSAARPKPTSFLDVSTPPAFVLADRVLLAAWMNRHPEAREEASA
jgi:hypothetical protein